MRREREIEGKMFINAQRLEIKCARMREKKGEENEKAGTVGKQKKNIQRRVIVSGLLLLLLFSFFAMHTSY